MSAKEDDKPQEVLGSQKKKWMIQHDQVEFEDNDGHGAE